MQVKTVTGVKIILATTLVVVVLPILADKWYSWSGEKKSPSSMADHVLFWTPGVLFLINLCLIAILFIAIPLTLAAKYFNRAKTAESNLDNS